MTPIQSRPEDIVGAYEIAERSGLGKTRVANYPSRYPDYPAPIANLSMGRIYDWQEVRVWLIRRGLLSRDPAGLRRGLPRTGNEA